MRQPFPDTAATPPGYPPASYAWYVVGVLVLATVLSYTDRQILSLLVDPMRRDLQISDTQMGLLMGSAFAFVYGIAGIPLGWLADRTCRRNLIVAGITLWSIGTVCCGLAANFTQFFGARLLVGVGEAVLTPASVAIISDSFPERIRGKATSVFLMGVAMGGGGAILFGGVILRLVTAGVLRGTPLEQTPAWRAVLLLLGLLGVIPAVLVTMVREPARVHGIGLTERIEAGAVSPREWVRLIPLFMAMSAASLVDNATLAWVPSVLVRGFGLSAGFVGPLLGTLLMLAGGGGMLAGGLVSDRARTSQSGGGRIPVALIAALATIPVTALVTSSSLNGVLAGVTLYVFLACISESAGTLSLLDAVPNHRHGLVTAVSFFLNVAFGAGIGPVAVGWVADHFALTGRALASAILSVACPGFVLVSGLLYLALRIARNSARGRSISSLRAALD
jgi:MFS family permease